MPINEVAMSTLAIEIISILATALIAVCAYVFVSNRSEEKNSLKHHQELIESLTDTQTKMGTLLGRHDERLKSIENKLRIR